MKQSSSWAVNVVYAPFPNLTFTLFHLFPIFCLSASRIFPLQDRTADTTASDGHINSGKQIRALFAFCTPVPEPWSMLIGSIFCLVSVLKSYPFSNSKFTLPTMMKPAGSLLIFTGSIFA